MFKDGVELFSNHAIDHGEKQLAHCRYMSEFKMKINEERLGCSGHWLIQSLNRQGRLQRCYTQNIDSLHRKILLDVSNRVVECHGNLDEVFCNQGHYQNFDSSITSRFELGNISCNECKKLNLQRKEEGKRLRTEGVVRPTISLYDLECEKFSYDEFVWQDLNSSADTIIVIGTSLKVVGIQNLVKDLANHVINNNKGIGIVINQHPINHGCLKSFQYHFWESFEHFSRNILFTNNPIESTWDEYVLERSKDRRRKKLPEIAEELFGNHT